MTSRLSIVENRRARNWTFAELLGRAAWRIAWPFFRFCPRPLWVWRRVLLRIFGARVGRGAHIFPTVRITIPWNLELGNYSAVGDRVILYALGPIRIGERATVSQGVHLCAGTHDLMDPARRLIKLPIKVGEDSWVCADAFIGPGVTVGNHAVVGARSVVMKDVQPKTVVAGNPAKFIRELN